MGNTWSIGIFKEQNGFLETEFNQPANLISTFLGRNLRTGFQHIHTYADPFLFEEKGKLYLFAEIQAVGESGYINCWKFTDYEKCYPYNNLIVIILLPSPTAILLLSLSWR